LDTGNYDFKAKLVFKSSNEGGRNTPVFSGYRPHVEFDNYPEYLTSGSQTYLGKEKVLPGDTVDAEIKILGTEYFSRRLYVDKGFKFCEGTRTIGTGKIVEIINNELRIEPNTKETDFNINLYPNDIVTKIKNSDAEDFGKTLRIIQPVILENAELRSSRIVRAIIFLSQGRIDKLEDTLKIAKIDYRDLLLMAEYENRDSSNPIRVRNFSNEFGKERIK